MPLPEISEQEMLFVQEFVKDRNKVRAGLAVGLSPTYQGASKAAQKLLQKSPIKAWIKHLLRQQAKALKFKPSKVLRNWMLASQADPTLYAVDGDGKLTTAPGVPREFLRCVRKVRQTRTEKLGADNKLTVEYKTDIELRDPFGPECKLMEHYGELAAETTPAGATVEQLVRALAELGQHRGAGPEAAPVGAEPRPAESGVPE